MRLCYPWFETKRSMGWFKLCRISKGRGTRNSIILGHFSTMSHSQRSLKDEPKRKQKLSAIMVRLHFCYSYRVVLTSVSRTDSQRTLGSPILDRWRAFRRIRPITQRPRYSIRRDEVLPSDVPLELGVILQTSCPGRYTILLACGTQGPFLLRCRLRCVPVHGRPQQNLRLHNQSVRCATIDTYAMAWNS